MASELILSKERSALVVVDMQETFLEPIKVRGLIERNILLLMQIAQHLTIPILATTQNAEKLGGMTPALQEIPGVPVFNKLCFSCWQEEAFAKALQESGCQQILLTGVESHICVMQTALDLIEAGYQVHIPYDAVASRNKRDWKYALYRLQSGGAIITSVESAVYEWLGAAGTEEFRKVLPLLKAHMSPQPESPEETE